MGGKFAHRIPKGAFLCTIESRYLARVGSIVAPRKMGSGPRHPARIPACGGQPATPRSSRRSPRSCSTTTPSATPSRTTRSGSNRSVGAAKRRRRCTSLVPGNPRRHAAAIIGLGATARHPQHQPRPAATDPATLCGRPAASAARTDKEGSKDRRISARRPHRYPTGRRGHARTPDADPLRTRWLIAAYVDAHAGYAL